MLGDGSDPAWLVAAAPGAMVEVIDGLLVALGTLVVVATGLSLVRGGQWWARLFDFPRQQTGAVGLVALIGLLADGGASPAELAFAGILGLAVGYQAWCILPYTPLWRHQVLGARDPRPERALSLLIANVLMDNRNVHGLLGLVRSADPDIVLAMEADDFWATKMASALDNAYPCSLKHPLANTYGMVLFSRLALEDAEVRFLVEEEVPSFRARVVLRSGDAFTFYGVHPRPPYLLQDASRRDAELLLVGREVRERGGGPALVAGDLNDVAWSHTTRLFQRISGLLDPRIGRGLYSTFHAKYPFLRWPLDHVFFDDDFRLRRLERLPAFGSDHFPMFIELSYEPARAAAQETPETEPGDRREAVERIEEGREQAATEEPQI